MDSPIINSSLKPIHDVDIKLSAVTSNRRNSASSPGGKIRTPGSPKKKRKGKKDGFNKTFGRIKAIDPLAEENKKRLENMEKGFGELLALHNTVELSSLCGMLSIKIERKTKNTEKKDLIMSYIRKRIDAGESSDAVYISILKWMWEGTLFEYLRAKGQPLHSTENDPRGFVIAYWRKMTKTIVPFDPYYVPQTLNNRSKDDRRSEDITAILDTMEQKEKAVKAAEHKIRREHDYTNVLTYLQSVSSLHGVEREGRNYLIGEVEMCRAKVSHAEESMAMLNSQLTDLENRHEYVKENYIENAAHTEFVGGDYFDQLVNNQGDQQFLNNLLRRQLLDIRSNGKDGFAGEEPDNEEEPAKVARAKADATMRANSYDEIANIHDTEQLLRRLGVRNRRERQALKMELREALDRESLLRSTLDSVEEQLEDQSERADDAEATLFALRAQSDQFKDRVAAREAVIETEASEYFDLAAQSMAGEKDLASKVSNVTPAILRMLKSDSLDTVKEAAKIAEGLGIMSRDGVTEALENVTMMKEEVRQREAEILATVKRAKTPKKGGKEKGKEAKGKSGTKKKKKKG